MSTTALARAKERRGKAKERKAGTPGASWALAMARMARAKVKARKARAKENTKERTKARIPTKVAEGIVIETFVAYVIGHWENECPLYSANQVTTTGGGNGSQQGSDFLVYNSFGEQWWFFKNFYN